VKITEKQKQRIEELVNEGLAFWQIDNERARKKARRAVSAALRRSARERGDWFLYKLFRADKHAQKDMIENYIEERQEYYEGIEIPECKTVAYLLIKELVEKTEDPYIINFKIWAFKPRYLFVFKVARELWYTKLEGTGAKLTPLLEVAILERPATRTLRVILPFVLVNFYWLRRP
jgi:hypothetical protein